MISDEEPVDPVCISNIHAEDVPATVRGTWMEHDTQYKTSGIWYCAKCAATGEALRLFARDKEEVQP